MKPSIFEVQNNSHSQFGDAKVVQHLAAFVVGNLIHDLCVNNHRIKRDQIRNEQADFNTSEKDREAPLLIEGNVMGTE